MYELFEKGNKVRFKDLPPGQEEKLITLEKVYTVGAVRDLENPDDIDDDEPPEFFFNMIISKRTRLQNAGHPLQTLSFLT